MEPFPRLVERIGATGKKRHTARSRNDQVATDLRLYLRQEIDAIRGALDHVLVALVDLAERVYPTSDRTVGEFGHHMPAWCEMLFRDRSR